FSSRRGDTRFSRDWSSDVCSSDLRGYGPAAPGPDDKPPGYWPDRDRWRCWRRVAGFPLRGHHAPGKNPGRPAGTRRGGATSPGKDRKSVVEGKGVEEGGVGSVNEH